jgi:endonuclease/exonuclease/phosphatase family metal-dependent hydrolase
MMKDNIRVASYNMRKARGLDQRHMPERILQVINLLNADIVVLQEADFRLGARLSALPRAMIEQETDFQVVDVAQNGVSLGWHGNAILLRKGISAAAVHPLTLPGLEPRGAVRLDLDLGARLSVVATHLGLRRKDRRAQLTALQTATQGSHHTLIAGDFNEWSRTKGFEPLEPRFVVHTPGRSFHASRPIAALDRFALSEGLRMQDAGVEQGALARRASDHLPIWADIELPLLKHDAEDSLAAS